MRVADEFFQIGHDQEGEPRIRTGALRLGLAGGLLAELAWVGALAVDGDVLWPVEGRPPGDGLAHLTLDRVAAEPEHRQVRTWLAFLGQDAAELVAARLVRGRSWSRLESRRLGRTTVAHRPVDSSRAGWPQARLWAAAQDGEPFPEPDRVLAGLVGATGLSWLVFRDAGPHAAEHVTREKDRLPPPLRDLVDQVAAAVGDAVLTHRT